MEANGKAEGLGQRSEAILAAAARVRTRLQSYAEDVEETGLIHFDLGNDRFAIETTWVGKIERIPALTPVPNSLSFVKGIANLRGAIVPVLDLAAMLELEESQGEPRGMLVLKDGQRQFGVLSDALPDYLRISPERIEPAPKSADIVSSILSGAVRMDDRLIGIIDGLKLFALVARLSNAE